MKAYDSLWSCFEGGSGYSMWGRYLQIKKKVWKRIKKIRKEANWILINYFEI